MNINASEGISTITISILFFSRPNYVYSCLDARFYDDEMLTVVLQGSEEENRKRVLAQLPLASALSCETEFNWQTNLRCVCVYICIIRYTLLSL